MEENRKWRGTSEPERYAGALCLGNHQRRCSTGTYIVGRLGQHWADLDKPSVPDAADLDTYRKLIGANVQSLVTRYYEYMPKVSNPGESGGSLEVLRDNHLSRARRPRNGIPQRHGAYHRGDFKKPSRRVNYSWYELVNGGPDGTFVLSIPHANWADFEDKPERETVSRYVEGCLQAGLWRPIQSSSSLDASVEDPISLKLFNFAETEYIGKLGITAK